jgi:hypothetical protein
VRMLSSLDSTPATACCRNEPHLEDCFVGAAIVSIPARAFRRCASIEVAPGHTSQFVVTVRRQNGVLEKLPAGLPSAVQICRKNLSRNHCYSDLPSRIFCVWCGGEPRPHFGDSTLNLAALGNLRGCNKAGEIVILYLP